MTMEIARLQTGEVVNASKADAGAHRERQRQRRLLKIALVLLVPTIWFWVREFSGNPRKPNVLEFHARMARLRKPRAQR